MTMTRQQFPPRRTRPGNEQRIYRFSILGAILLCVLIALLLGDSLISAYQVDVGSVAPRGWRWLLGADAQTFGTQTFALLLGVTLMGFAIGGLWFLVRVRYRLAARPAPRVRPENLTQSRQGAKLTLG